MRKGDSRTTVQSVERSLRLLEEIAGSTEVGLADLARATDLRPSTAHRLLATLIECGYVIQGPDSSRYRLGHRVLSLAGAMETRLARLRAAARPCLVALHDRYDETTNLGVLDRFSLVYVDQLESSRAVRMFTRIGSRVPAFATGAGKALLAFQPKSELDDLLAHERLEQLTPNTIATGTRLREELARVRRRGYALDREEYEEGVVCVAAPIFDQTGTAQAAVSISGPAARMQRLDLVDVGERIVGLALQTSGELGYTAA